MGLCGRSITVFYRSATDKKPIKKAGTKPAFFIGAFAINAVRFAAVAIADTALRNSRVASSAAGSCRAVASESMVSRAYGNKIVGQVIINTLRNCSPSRPLTKNAPACCTSIKKRSFFANFCGNSDRQHRFVHIAVDAIGLGIQIDLDLRLPLLGKYLARRAEPRMKDL